MNLSAADIINASNYFTSDYHQSRHLYLAKLQDVEHLTNDKKAWQLDARFGTDLYIDTVWLGSRQAKNVLVIISATHGVEGYCGSAAQSFLLDQFATLERIEPKDFAVLIIHSLNPWGMYWARRCDQSGIDLNRNFNDFSTPITDSEAVQVWLNILELEEVQARFSAIEDFKDRLGQQKFEEVISAGQYSKPWAPFFGGQAPSFANETIENIINGYQLAGKELVVIDIHSGLGPYAFGELISDHPIDSSGARFAEQLFGDTIASTAKGESFSAPKFGLMDYRWHQLMQDSGCYITLEFGTYNSDQLFHTLLNEHLFWARSDHKTLKNDAYQEHRKAMLQQFCPDHELWHQAVLFKVWQLINRVIRFYQ